MQGASEGGTEMIQADKKWGKVGNDQRIQSNVAVQSLSCVQLFVSPWTAARQASLSITNF